MVKDEKYSYTKKDFDIRWFNGSVRAGGQNINKTQNCVKITHIQSGLSAQSTAHRDRKANFRDAFQALGEKLKPWILEQINKEIPQREEKPEIIRTYHHVDNYVKDHVSNHVTSWKEFEKDFDQFIVQRKNSKHET